VVETVISLVVFVASLGALRDGRRRDRRDLLLKLHEQFLAEQRQVGRRLLYEYSNQSGSSAQQAVQVGAVTGHLRGASVPQGVSDNVDQQQRSSLVRYAIEGRPRYSKGRSGVPGERHPEVGPAT
jgi:hypothetical protein